MIIICHHYYYHLSSSWHPRSQCLRFLLQALTPRPVWAGGSSSNSQTGMTYMQTDVHVCMHAGGVYTNVQAFTPTHINIHIYTHGQCQLTRETGEVGRERDKETERKRGREGEGGGEEGTDGRTDGRTDGGVKEEAEKADEAESLINLKTQVRIPVPRPVFPLPPRPVFPLPPRPTFGAPREDEEAPRSRSKHSHRYTFRSLTTCPMFISIRNTAGTTVSEALPHTSRLAPHLSPHLSGTTVSIQHPLCKKQAPTSPWLDKKGCTPLR
jgi:hypothetical protein